jgi:HD-like signal output (HDOD) protein
MSPVLFAVRDLLEVAQSITAAPRILADLGRLLRDPNTDLGEVAIQLKHDSALASRLLRIANGAAFAQSEPVGSVEEAAALIGFAEIHRLVGAIAIAQFSADRLPLYGISGRRLRENSLIVALLMEELAGPAQEDPRACYTIGLFRSLGKFAVEKLAVRGEPLAPFDPAGPDELTVWETHQFGRTGNDATAAILHQWHFPHEISKAIAEHHCAAGRSHPLTHLLNLAAGTAEKLGYGLPGESIYWLETEEVYRKSGVDPRDSKGAIDRAFVAFDRLSGALG